MCNNTSISSSRGHGRRVAVNATERPAAIAPVLATMCTADSSPTTWERNVLLTSGGSGEVVAATVAVVVRDLGAVRVAVDVGDLGAVGVVVTAGVMVPYGGL